MMSWHRQRGITTVEFAIVGLLLFTMIFGVIEVARGYYVYTMLGDVARRGARLAAVCPVNDPAVSQMAVYNASGNTGESSQFPANSIRKSTCRRLRTYVRSAIRCRHLEPYDA